MDLLRTAFLSLVTVALVSCTRRNDDLLNAQFLDVNQEVQAAGFQDNTVNVIKPPEERWYETKIVKGDKVSASWKDIRLADELQSKDTHTLREANLSFSFPFFGRTVSSLLVSSAGCLLLGNPDDPLPVPSHIAPLLSSLPPGNDEIVFHDFGNSFTVQWTKHYLHDDHYKQEIEVTIYQDGSMVFLYHNLLQKLLDLANDGGYPIVIGLQDGFTVPMDGKILDIYLYPVVHITPFDLVSNWTMVEFTPVQDSCEEHQNKADCDVIEACKWQRISELCMYHLEIFREKHRDESDEAPSSCNEDCPGDYAPVCGTDNITYQNNCTLQALACKHNNDVKFQAVGTCSQMSQKANCTDVCPTLLKPVCGSDGVTYSNECLLEAGNCRVGGNVTKVKDGKCDESDESKEYEYDSDIDDGNQDEGEGDVSENDTSKEIVNKDDQKDPCFKKCPKNLDPVCLNGNRMFNNECLMYVAACQEHIVVSRWHKGTCTTAGDSDKETHPSTAATDATGLIDCSSKDVPCTRELRPLCASDGSTYHNLCLMKQIACQLGLLDLRKVSDGPCLDGKERKGCADEPPCTKEINLVCGSDGVTYNNKCLLEVEAACYQHDLRMDHEGPCHNANILRSQDMPGEGHRHERRKLNSALKGAAFVATLFALGILVFAVVKIYMRPKALPVMSSSRSTSPPTIPSSAISLPSGPIGAPQNPPVPVNASVEMGVIRGVTNPGVKYDKLPLVPHMDEEQQFSNI